MTHEKASEYAGRTVMWGDSECHVEYWCDRVSGGSWMFAGGNPAAIKYAMHVLRERLPLDDEVVYGKVNGLGYLVHVSELGGES